MIQRILVRQYFSQLPAILACTVLLVLVGCASKLPESIRVAPASQPTIDQARHAADRYVGTAVRWGGELVEVRNQRASTELEILGRQLDSDGEPRPNSNAQGRFIARVEGFIDPADYQSGQLLTVAGKLSGKVSGKVGEYDYLYPVVDVAQVHRWPEPVQNVIYPAYPGPYYGPWWPHRYYGWPYPWW